MQFRDMLLKLFDLLSGCLLECHSIGQNCTAVLANYEKLQLARIATDACKVDKALKERMDESVHVCNCFLYQLDPTRFELVLSQLIERCRDEIVNMDGGK